MALDRMYGVMQTIRRCDDRIREEVRSGRMQAAFYPVRGLEAVCASLGEVLQPTDALVSTYRNLGDAIAKGVDLTAILAEALGRAAGASKGKGGPMHIQDPAAGLTLTTGVVGSGLPIAVGLALAAQRGGKGRVAAVTFGDGATSIGAYHEAMNMASLWHLPLVFVCQSNGWAEHTPTASFAPATDLAARAGAYAMTAEAVDGFDPIATLRVLTEAVQACRSGAGPRFVEARTYRMAGHVATDDTSYMPAEELERAAQRDPVPTFRDWLLAHGKCAEAALAVLDAEAQRRVDDAWERAFQSPPPDPGELLTDLWELAR